MTDTGFSFEVRLAKPGDFQAVDRLFAQSYPALLSRDYTPQELDAALPLMAQAKPELLASGSYFVAISKGSVVGAGGWTAEPPGTGAAEPGVGHIRHVVTSHRHTRRGIARGLMGEVLGHARANGIKKLACLSTRTAEPFYQTMGFRSLKPIEVPIGGQHPFPAIVMELSFSPCA